VEKSIRFRVRDGVAARRLQDSRRVAGATLTPQLVLLALVSLGCALLLRGAPAEKHLSVYSVAANYSLPLIQQEGHDYVGLLEVLEPLGKVSAKADGSKWRLKYNNTQAEFQAGKTRARVQNHDVDLGGNFAIENSRGLVPLGSLTSLLPRILGGPVSLHEVAHRLFIGSVATHFTASLAGDNPPRLVFRFSAPVNPSIATEQGFLRMTFSRDPIVGPAAPTLTFGNKIIPSATYSESNGSALVTVSATAPDAVRNVSNSSCSLEHDTSFHASDSATPHPGPAATASASDSRTGCSQALLRHCRCQPRRRR